MSSKQSSHFSSASNLIIAKNETAQQERRNEHNKKQFIQNNNDANVLANVLQQEVGFQDLTNITKEEATNIKDELLNEIRQYVEKDDFNNDVNNMFASRFSQDVFNKYRDLITQTITQRLSDFKTRMIEITKDRLTALSNSNWNNLSGISPQEKQCYVDLESAFCQKGLGNTIGLEHLKCLKNNKEVFQVFKNCSILATILPVWNEISSTIDVTSLEQAKQQATGQLKSIKAKYENIFTNQGYDKTFPKICLDLFCSGFEMNCSNFDNGKKGESWLKMQIRELARVRLKCDITKFENWQTITKKVDDLSKYYKVKTTQQQIWINNETELLKEICEGLLKYLNTQLEQNQYLRDDKENGTIIEAQIEEESENEENNVDVANNEKNDNINNNDKSDLSLENKDDDKDIDSKQDEKNGAIEENKQSNPSSKNDIGINEEVQENSNSVNENELEVIDLYVDENKPNNEKDEKKDIDSKQDEKNREMEEEKQSNASSKKNSKSNNSCVDENEFGVINFNLNNNDGNHNNIVNQHQNENNNDRVLESLTVNYFAGNNNINNNVGVVANKTDKNNENNTNRDKNNNILNQNENNNENEQNIINEPRDEIPEVDTQIELGNNDLQQIYNRSFNINTLRARGLNPQNTISFTADAMKNIQPRCGIACLFSKKANLENTLYETLQRNRQNNNDRPTIRLQQLADIINTAGGCC